MPPEFLRECFEYNPETGILHWKKRPIKHFLTEREWKLVNTRQAGKVAGYERKRSDGKGYLYVKVCGATEAVHRIALLISGVSIPSGMVVDHINGNRHDNRIHNLRVVTASVNAMNSKKRVTNTSGHHGIQWRKSRNCWTVRFIANGKAYACGDFKSLDDAIKRRDESLVRLGFSDMHGKERGE